jgi:predicted metalloprotease
VQYDDNARLDTSEVLDNRGGGGFSLGGGPGLALGGGGLGIIGVIVYLIFTFVGGSGSSSGTSLSNLGNGQTASSTNVASECRTGSDANSKLDCAVVADINSIQDYWTTELPKLGAQYRPVPTVWFSGQVQTGCGAASSAAGPFYCPADKRVYLDLSFYNDLQTQFGAQGGLFVDAYVLAHEYGHHVQDLLGILDKIGNDRQGANSASVKSELQADCFAGVWANQANRARHILEEGDLDEGLQAASAVGDDRLQMRARGYVVPESFTHGSSAQRARWFRRGLDQGAIRACDTFNADRL